MSQFYLTLPSNSSARYYSNNTLTKFTTKLLTTVDVSGPWEVGLSEISFTKSWHNVIENHSGHNLAVHCPESFSPEGLSTEEAIQIDSETYGYGITIPEGHYDSMEMFVETINRSIVNRLSDPTERRGVPARRDGRRGGEPSLPKFVYNPNTRRVNVSLHHHQKIWISDSLIRVMGFGRKQVPFVRQSGDDLQNIFGKRPADINSALQHIFVYTDVAENIPVGDTSAPLLRIINTDGKHGQQIHSYFDRPRYLPLQKKNFDSITIDIRDDTGRSVPFEFGRAIVILHFRQAKHSYFTQ